MRGRGRLERAVMDCLWDRPEGLAASEVVELLEPDPPALTTVLTVLDRLRAKGLVTRQREGASYRHRPVRSREELAAEAMVDALTDTGDRSMVLSRFVAAVSDADAALLREALGTRGPEPRTVPAAGSTRASRSPR